MYEINNSEIFSVDIVKDTFRFSAQVKEKIFSNDIICNAVAKAAEIIAESLAIGGKVLICGNGGSASDALHFCGEVVGRFQKERKAAPAIPLNADVATMTAVGNDYGYEVIFERGVQAFMKSDDVFIGISTSGNSENVLKAVKAAKEIGGTTIAFLGKTGGKIKNEVDIPIVVPSDNTARIQESHICIIHTICDLIERTLE